jgi:hypothetical protein
MNKKFQRIKQQSDATKARMCQYQKAKAEFLELHSWCEAHVRVPTNSYQQWRATEIHHSRGRLGALLTDTRYFVAVCQSCHRWIHDHPGKARQLNLLCEMGDWNKQPND